MPFDSEAAQTTYQTTYDTNMATVNVANYYTYNSATTGAAVMSSYITQGDYTLAVPTPDPTNGASAITVIGAVSLALLSATF